MKGSWTLAVFGLLGAVSLARVGPGDVTAVSVLPSAGSAVIVIDVQDALSVNDFTLVNPPRLVVDVGGARLKVPGVSYDGANRGGIVAIRYSQFRPDVVRIVIELDALKDYQLEYVDDAIRIEFSTDHQFSAWSSGELPRVALPPETPEDDASLVDDELLNLQQFQQDRITVTWDSASIAEVMAGFAEFSGRSIVLGQAVRGVTVTAQIRDQPWDIALREILAANGFAAEEDPETGIIRIVDPRQMAIFRDSLAPRTTVVLPVNFARAASVAAVLQQVMGTRGTVVADSLTNQLIITDIVSEIGNDTSLVRQLDRPTPQISIKAKLIFVDRTDIEQLGVRYDLGNSVGCLLRQAPGCAFFNKLVQRPDPATLVGVDTDGDGVNDAAAFGGNFDPNTNIIGLGGSSLAAIGNADANLGGNPALQLIFSTALGNFSLTAFLDALQEVQLADLQAEPMITTADNTEANILVGERTPIRVLDASAGATGGTPVATIRFEETGIRLRVTPHVTNTGQVMMKVVVENSSIREAPSDIGFTLQTQNTSNEILVNDGETMVIGGLTVTQVTVSKSGIPFLVDLPILGRIFGFTSRREQRRDLLILVTPTIVYDPLADEIR